MRLATQRVPGHLFNCGALKSHSHFGRLIDHLRPSSSSPAENTLTLLELAPFTDGDLDDPDLDAPFPHGEPLPIAPIPLATGEAADVVLRPVTVAEALSKKFPRREIKDGNAFFSTRLEI